MYHLGEISELRASELTKTISALPYVHEAIAIAVEGMLIVKIKNQQTQEAQNEQEILAIIGTNNGSK